VTVKDAHRETGVDITCMETCQGHEWGIACSPLTTLGVAVEGVTAGFPQSAGQSGKRKYILTLSVNKLLFVTMNSTCIHTRIVDGPIKTFTFGDPIFFQRGANTF